jgi:hypothetical protein
MIGIPFIGIRSHIARVPLEITWGLPIPSPLELVGLVLLLACDARGRILVRGATQDSSNVFTRIQTKEPSQERSRK